MPIPITQEVLNQVPELALFLLNYGELRQGYKKSDKDVYFEVDSKALNSPEFRYVSPYFVKQKGSNELIIPNQNQFELYQMAKKAQDLHNNN